MDTRALQQRSSACGAACSAASSAACSCPVSDVLFAFARVRGQVPKGSDDGLHTKLHTIGSDLHTIGSDLHADLHHIAPDLHQIGSDLHRVGPTYTGSCTP